jgi:hypothetical protein
MLVEKLRVLHHYVGFIPPTVGSLGAWNNCWMVAFIRTGSAGVSTAPAVWLAYSEDRKGEHPKQRLTKFKGALQADASSGFHHLYGDGAIYEVACWNHSRAKFHDIHVAHAS